MKKLLPTNSVGGWPLEPSWGDYCTKAPLLKFTPIKCFWGSDYFCHLGKIVWFSEQSSFTFRPIYGEEYFFFIISNKKIIIWGIFFTPWAALLTTMSNTRESKWCPLSTSLKKCDGCMPHTQVSEFRDGATLRAISPLISLEVEVYV